MSAACFKGQAVNTQQAGAFDRDEARRALALLPDQSARVQLQSRRPADFANLPAADHGAALDWLEAHAAAQYLWWSLNPLPPLDRQARVADPLARRWLLVDLDAIHPRDTNATDEEHAAAGEVALAVLDDLCDRGWPLPVLDDSGNGWHLLWRINEPNDDETRDLVHGCLNVISALYGGDRAKVGTECFDSRRLCKLPGTWARKGPHSPERPHRMCRMVRVPEPLEVVSREQLEALAAPVVEPAAPAGKAGSNGSAFHGRAGSVGRADAEARAIAYLGRCAPAVSGQGGHNALMWAARVVVYGFDLGPAVGLRLLQQHYNPSCQPPWSEKELLHKVGQADSKPFPRPRGWLLGEQGGGGNGAGGGSKGPAAAAVRAEAPLIVTLSDLMAMQIPEPRWVVPGILSEGLTLLAGKPKLGKSFLALNIAITVALGLKALGDQQTAQGDVLYLSLEDRFRRLQQRARRMLAALGVGPTPALSISTRWPRQDQGGMDHLERWIEGAARPSLVIIDVWTKFRTPLRPGSQYEQDYAHASLVKDLCDKKALPCLALHHCKKAKAEDVLDEISGTLGLAGCADGSLILRRCRQDTEAELFMTGRDIDERSLALSFDAQTFLWTSLGPAEEHVQGKLQVAVVEYLKAKGGPAFASDIAAALGKEPEQIRPVLHRLRDKNIISHPGNAWAWPGDGGANPFDKEK